MKMDDPLMLKLNEVIETQALAAYRDIIIDVERKLNVDTLECAAALLFLMSPGINAPFDKNIDQADASAISFQQVNPPAKMIRYRLDVGRKLGLSKDALYDLLVEESGVERKMIGNPDIRAAYTLVELPEGMPEDIFQHLKLVEFNHHKLNIKRVGSNYRKKRHHDFKRSKQGARETQKRPTNDALIDDNSGSGLESKSRL